MKKKVANQVKTTNQPIIMTKQKKVSQQISDAVTQANVKVVAEAPAMAIGSIYQSAAHSLGMAFENSVYAQQQANVTYQAAVTMSVQSLKSK